MQFNQKGSDGKRLKQMYTIGTVKHGGSKWLMVCGYFSGFSGLGPLSHRT